MLARTIRSIISGILKDDGKGQPLAAENQKKLLMFKFNMKLGLNSIVNLNIMIKGIYGSLLFASRRGKLKKYRLFKN